MMIRFKISLGVFLAVMSLAAGSKQILTPTREQMEDQLFFLVNQERARRGLSELRFAAQLHDMARAHSEKMLQEKQLAHDFPGYDRLAVRAVQAGLRFRSIGENLAVGAIFVMRFFHEQMLASPGHCDNILFKDFTHLGVGIAQGGGKYYITEEFACLEQP
jgi:uncharacterized protein YkwD